MASRRRRSEWASDSDVRKHHVLEVVAHMVGVAVEEDRDLGDTLKVFRHNRHPVALPSAWQLDQPGFNLQQSIDLLQWGTVRHGTMACAVRECECESRAVRARGAATQPYRANTSVRESLPESLPLTPLALTPTFEHARVTMHMQWRTVRVSVDVVEMRLDGGRSGEGSTAQGALQVDGLIAVVELEVHRGV
jgi:hypothetical protein